jgi:hypothetical protein
MRGLDLHKREGRQSIKADDGTITDRRLATGRERFTAVFGTRPPARILLEASTESEWVARHRESLDAMRFDRRCWCTSETEGTPSPVSRCWRGQRSRRILVDG